MLTLPTYINGQLFKTDNYLGGLYQLETCLLHRPARNVPGYLRFSLACFGRALNQPLVPPDLRHWPTRCRTNTHPTITLRPPQWFPLLNDTVRAAAYIG